MYVRTSASGMPARTIVNPRAGESLRGFVDNMLSGSVGHSEFLRASRLRVIALEKPNRIR